MSTDPPRGSAASVNGRGEIEQVVSTEPITYDPTPATAAWEPPEGDCMAASRCPTFDGSVCCQVKNKPGPVVHYLVFRGKDEDDDYDFDVKHEPDRCPEAEWFWGRDYSCDVATELVDAGSYAFGVFDNTLDHLAPGTYVLRRWVEVHPATPSHGTEYSSGLEVGDRVA